MSSITTSVGLYSGLDIAGITDQLIAAQRAPADRMESRIAGFQGVQLGLQALEANVLTVAGSISKLTEKTTFDAVKVTNTDNAQLTVSTTSNTATGSYSFQVLQVASAEQRLSKGFANSDQQTLGAGSITLSKGGELSTATRLDTFNGGEGVQRGSIKITDRSGESATIDLSAAFDIDDVLSAINENGDISVTASTSGGRLVLTDTTGSTSSNLIVAEIGTGTTAADLGIAGSVSADSVTGSEVHYLTGDFTLDQINDGNGIFQVEGLADLRISLQDETTLDIDFDSIFNLTELVSAINDHDDNGGKVTASLTNGRLVVTDSTTGSGTFGVSDLNGASVVEPLGLNNAVSGNTLTGDRLLAGIGSRLLRNLNGGNGITTPGQISVTDRSGLTATIDLSSAESLDEVINAINSAEDSGQPLSLTARLDSLGTGIEIVDTSGATASNLIISDVTGTTAADLGITIDAAATSVSSGSLGLRKIAYNTVLSDYADGGSVEVGSFLIKDADGNQESISISSSVKTIGDVLDRINSASTVQVKASLNETGDGIVIEDLSGGSGTLEIEEVTGSTAADLRILGTGTVGTSGNQEISGQAQTVIEVEATDTLDSLVTKINDAGVGISASIVNDGSAFNSFRLSLTSTRSGASGAFLIDTDSLNLGLAVTTEGQDARLQVGSNTATSFLVSSSSNSFTNVVGGVNVSANSVGTSAAQVKVNRNTDTVKSTLQALVGSYNTFISTSAELTKFDPATNQKGVLQGQGVVFRVQSRLDSLLTKNYFGTNSDLQSLADLGVRVTTGGKLTFDTEVFDSVAASDPDGIRSFFLDEENGVAKKIDTTLDTLTDSVDGVFATQKDQLQESIDRLQTRVTEIDSILALRRDRLLSSFIRTEKLIGQVQSQQEALNAFTTAQSN
jgi:flagellar hook-associated protein 2